MLIRLLKLCLVWIFSILIFVSLLCSCSPKISELSPGVQQNQFSCNYGVTKRSFYLYLPEAKNYSETKLVVMLHGYGNSGYSFSQDTEFEKSALPKNFAVLYIDGLPNASIKKSAAGWNYFYDKNGQADINFIVDLVHFVQKKFGLSKKAYVVGFSNGAFMTTKLAVEKSKYFDGFVSVGGMMPKPVWDHKKQGKTEVRFFQINGTKDDVVPMRLNDSAKYNPNPAMEDVIEYFVVKNGLTEKPEKQVLSDRIKITKYADTVWWIIIEDFHHSWPTISNCQLNVNEIILEFFEKNCISKGRL